MWDVELHRLSRRESSAWGKTDEALGQHPLAHHSVDVAAVFLRLLNTPVIADRLAAAAERALTETDRQRLAALAFLHDIGKLHPGFQAKGWPECLRPKRLRGHTSESWLMQMVSKWAQTASPDRDSVSPEARHTASVPGLSARPDLVVSALLSMAKDGASPLFERKIERAKARPTGALPSLAGTILGGDGRDPGGEGGARRTLGAPAPEE
ncbi:MAG: HD domain-containing protein [Gammaproteobacteria bacterium]|nr:HD domain-containing protein [Gammaproteobacteria bacterium]